MTTTIYPVDATAGAPTYSGRMLRQVGSVAFSGATSARPLGARSGVRPGTSATTVIVSSTQWSVGPHAGVLDLEAAAESGPTPYSIDAPVAGSLRAADGFARVDLVWVRQDIPLEDGSAAPAVVPGYTYGTVAGTPPATPARCMVLAWINVPASGGGGPSVQWKAPYLSAQVFMARNATERDAFPAGTAECPTLVLQADGGTGGLLMRNSGSGWVSMAGDDTGWVDITLAAGFAIQSGPNPSVRRINGITYIRGLIRPNPAAGFGMAAVTVGTIPALFRPPTSDWKYVQLSGASVPTNVSAVIKDTGEIEVACSDTNSAWVSLTCAPWPAS